MTADAWDECADCGHDRDDHGDPTRPRDDGGDCIGSPNCRCTGFLEAVS